MLRCKGVLKEPSSSGVTPSPFTVTFEVAGVTSPFTSIESLVIVGEPEGDLTTSSGLEAVSFPPHFSYSSVLRSLLRSQPRPIGKHRPRRQRKTHLSILGQPVV